MNTSFKTISRPIHSYISAFISLDQQQFLCVGIDLCACKGVYMSFFVCVFMCLKTCVCTYKYSSVYKDGGVNRLDIRLCETGLVEASSNAGRGFM